MRASMICLMLCGFVLAAFSCEPTAKRQADSCEAVVPATAPVAFDADHPQTQFECRWTDSPITIDGRADEPAWKNAQVIDHFLIPWKKGKDRQPLEATSAKVLWDREYFYYFADMKDSDLYAVVSEHNGKIWTDDAFELFFKPADNKPGYYEFEVNPLNARMELFIPARDTGGWDKYKLTTNIKHETAVQLHGTLNNHDDKDEGWSVEGRIRWADFAPTGGRPLVGETWKFSACRVNINGENKTQELSTCSPLTQPSYHRYEDYATLKFVRGDMTNAPPRAVPDRVYGIDHRPKWTTSAVAGFPDPPMPYTVTPAFPRLKIFQPLYAVAEPENNSYFLLQHLGNREGPGKLVRFKNDPDVDSVEELLPLNYLPYGMTLHPDFAHNGYLYIIANGPMKAENPKDRILRYAVDRNPPFKIDPKSEVTILEWESGGHDGGDLAFGPDGFLYMASGDGSTDSDTNNRGQNTSFLTSKMIRIDVDHPEPGKMYSIPRDNPWINTPGFQPEAWAYGFRNPWRLAFDSKTGDLWVGQNGQDLWEEVYLVHKGENYGWSRYEGSHPFQPLRKPAPTPVTFPIVEHPHSEMRSLTGGVVYRGTKFPELDGAFLYGDWSTGRIWGVKSEDHQHATWHKELARTTLQITGFRETADGDVLVMDQGGAAIYKLAVNEQRVAAHPFPRKLSETGLFVSTKDNRPDPGLIPYDVNAPLWSDGALKERFIALPGDGYITFKGSRGWDLPEGSVLVKTFSLELEAGVPASGKRLETRLLTKTLGQWIGYTYLWNDEQTDATLIDSAGTDKTYTIHDPATPGGVREQTWHFPSRAECMTCHSRAIGFVLGLSTLQMNRDFTYPDGVKDNQLRVLEHLGLFRGDLGREKASDQRQVPGGTDVLLPSNPEQLEHLPNPADPHADLTARVRSYLHANCAICHIEAGGGNALMNLEYGASLDETRLVDVKPQHDNFGNSAARLIAPGRPDDSILLHRLSIRGNGQMPPLASSRVDENAMKMLREWVASLPAKP